MPHEVEEKGDYVEVRASGQLSEWEVLAIVAALRARDPLKRLPDLWVLAPDAAVPLPALPFIARSIGRLFRPGVKVARSALVTADAVQGAVAEMYRTQAGERLPFEIGVFQSRDEALKWLKG